METDGELLRRAAEGDDEAVGRLLEKHGPEVRRRLSIPERWQSVLSEDDVMQQSYADAFLNISRFSLRGEGSFAAWLSTLAKRNLIDAIRLLETDTRGGKHQKITAVGSDDSFVHLYEMVGGVFTSPSQAVARKEAKSAIEQAIDKLPDDYRRVIVMQDLEERPLREVAQVLGRSPGATAMLRARAHRRLAEMMGTASRFLTGPS